MDNKLLLAKSITLLYRENQLADKTENSADLIRTVLADVTVSDIGIGINTERESIMALKATVLEMCGQPNDHVYEKTDILQRVRINVGSDDKYYDAIRQGIDDEMPEPSIKRSVTNIRRAIHNHFREKEIKDTLTKASVAFNYERDKIKDVNQFITDFVTKLESLQVNSSMKDPAVMSDLDLGSDESRQIMVDSSPVDGEGNNVYKTGWQAFNKMTQGGLRSGETVVIGALQHKYKTGFSLSLFSQLALHNKPKTKDLTKKPLILRISFEDDLVNNIEFLYQYLRYNDTREFVAVKGVSQAEMLVYIRDKLQVNGFSIRMMRVDPTQWTYKSICNKIFELEAQGFSVEILLLDYLAMVPTIGCTTSGAMGTDIRDQLRRVRNFCASKKILHITPHQLSTDAKNLSRNGMPEEKFVQEITEKGYHAGTKQLDQEMDLELYIHKFEHNKESFLCCQRGKHRISTILDDSDDKYYIMKFPHKMPIPEDINGEDSSFRRLPSRATASNTSDDMFKFGS